MFCDANLQLQSKLIDFQYVKFLKNTNNEIFIVFLCFFFDSIRYTL
jgi:hypothetical protein